jgi:hypothetical protein
MPDAERTRLISKLNRIDDELGRELEEEQIDPYETTKARLKAHQDPELARNLEKTIPKP